MLTGVFIHEAEAKQLRKSLTDALAFLDGAKLAADKPAVVASATRRRGRPLGSKGRRKQNETEQEPEQHDEMVLGSVKEAFNA